MNSSRRANFLGDKKGGSLPSRLLNFYKRLISIKAQSKGRACARVRALEIGIEIEIEIEIEMEIEIEI